MQKTGPAGAVITFGSLRTRLLTSISCPSTHALQRRSVTQLCEADTQDT